MFVDLMNVLIKMSQSAQYKKRLKIGFYPLDDLKAIGS